MNWFGETFRFEDLLILVISGPKKIEEKMKIIVANQRFILRETLPKDIERMYEPDADPEGHKNSGKRTAILNCLSSLFQKQKHMATGLAAGRHIDLP